MANQDTETLVKEELTEKKDETVIGSAHLAMERISQTAEAPVKEEDSTSKQKEDTVTGCTHLTVEGISQTAEVPVTEEGSEKKGEAVTGSVHLAMEGISQTAEEGSGNLTFKTKKETFIAFAHLTEMSIKQQLSGDSISKPKDETVAVSAHLTMEEAKPLTKTPVKEDNSTSEQRESVPDSAYFTMIDDKPLTETAVKKEDSISTQNRPVSSCAYLTMNVAKPLTKEPVKQENSENSNTKGKDETAHLTTNEASVKYEATTNVEIPKKVEHFEPKDKTVIAPDILLKPATKQEFIPNVIEPVMKREEVKNVTVEIDDEDICEIPNKPKDLEVIDLCEDDDGLDKDSALQLLYSKRFTDKADLLKSIYRSPRPKPNQPVTPAKQPQSYNTAVNVTPILVPADEPFIYLGGKKKKKSKNGSSISSSATSSPDVDTTFDDSLVCVYEDTADGGTSIEIPADNLSNSTSTLPLFQEDRTGDPDIQMIDLSTLKQRSMHRNTGKAPSYVEFDSYSKRRIRKNQMYGYEARGANPETGSQDTFLKEKQVPWKGKKRKNLGSAREGKRVARWSDLDSPAVHVKDEIQAPQKKGKENLDAPIANAAPADNIASLEVQKEHNGGLRPIAIDGPSIAVGHGQGKAFNCQGLQLCIEYFQNRGHSVKAFLPRWRMRMDLQGGGLPTVNGHLLKKLDADNLLVLTPSKSYDDRFVVQYAAQTGAVIVSFDAYLDIKNEHPEWLEAVDKRRLVPTWADDILMFPKDPLGRKGPNLTEFLQFPRTESTEPEVIEIPKKTVIPEVIEIS